MEVRSDVAEGGTGLTVPPKSAAPEPVGRLDARLIYLPASGSKAKAS
jgi:hypothetical protein